MLTRAIRSEDQDIQVPMTDPSRFLLRMLFFLAIVGAVIAIMLPGLQRAFLFNPVLNGLISGVFLFGVLHSIRQVWRLRTDISWIEDYRGTRRTLEEPPPPRLLAPMAAILGERHKHLALSPLAIRSILDGIAARLDETRDLSRYIAGLMIFLGLLGTFWGLSQTVGSIGGVIRSLTIQEGGDVAQMFESLKHGLGAPLSGMGTAFSSSLFGLSGSLVVGFLDLQTGQAQNRFFTELEDWLSGLSRLSPGPLVSDSEPGVPVYVQALLEQTAESLESLQQIIARGEESRTAGNTQLLALAERIGTLTDHMRAEQQLMLKLAEGQSELRPLLAKLAETARTPAAGLDEATRGHIRNMDVYAARIIEEMIVGRDELVRQVRSDIRLLARTIAAVSDDAPRQG